MFQMFPNMSNRWSTTELIYINLKNKSANVIFVLLGYNYLYTIVLYNKKKCIIQPKKLQFKKTYYATPFIFIIINL